METGTKTEKPLRLIRLKEVISRVGLGKTAIYDRMKENDFPKPVKLGTANGWVESEIDGWIQQQIDARGGKAA